MVLPYLPLVTTMVALNAASSLAAPLRHVESKAVTDSGHHVIDADKLKEPRHALGPPQSGAPGLTRRTVPNTPTGETSTASTWANVNLDDNHHDGAHLFGQSKTRIDSTLSVINSNSNRFGSSRLSAPRKPTDAEMSDLFANSQHFSPARVDGTRSQRLTSDHFITSESFRKSSAGPPFSRTPLQPITSHHEVPDASAAAPAAKKPDGVWKTFYKGSVDEVKKNPIRTAFGFLGTSFAAATLYHTFHSHSSSNSRRSEGSEEDMQYRRGLKLDKLD